MNKDNAKTNFIVMIENSWTYKRMTREEQTRLSEVFESYTTREAIKGTYDQRWATLQAIYSAYLIGLGYDGFRWREKDETGVF